MLLTIALASALTFNGNYTQGGLVKITAPEGSKIYLDEKKVHGYGSKYYIGFNYNAKPEYILSAIMPDGSKEAFSIPVTQRVYQQQAIKNISKELVQPTKQKQTKIDEQTIKVALARHETNLTCPELNFIRPHSGRISGVYGSKRTYNGKAAVPHTGTDFTGPVGDPVFAPEAGTVKLTENNITTGKTMVIDHGCGITSTFLHLNEFDKKPGAKVKQGEQVAKIGKTGIATGPHLHWSMNLSSIRLDPMLLVK